MPVMKNIGAVLAAAGLDYGDVVKTTIFLNDMADFAGLLRSARERGEAPSVPEGMAALSKLYEINVPADSPGPLSVEVKLTSVDVEVGSLAYYAWDGQGWSRIGPVDLGPDGTTVTGSCWITRTQRPGASP